MANVRSSTKRSTMSVIDERAAPMSMMVVIPNQTAGTQ